MLPHVAEFAYFDNVLFKDNSQISFLYKAFRNHHVRAKQKRLSAAVPRSYIWSTPHRAAQSIHLRLASPLWHKSHSWQVDERVIVGVCSRSFSSLAQTWELALIVSLDVLAEHVLRCFERVSQSQLAAVSSA